MLPNDIDTLDASPSIKEGGVVRARGRSPVRTNSQTVKEEEEREGGEFEITVGDQVGCSVLQRVAGC